MKSFRYLALIVGGVFHSVMAVFPIWVTDLVMGKVASCHSSLTSCDHVLVIFMRLRLGLLYKDLAHRFGVPESTMSKVYRTWLPVLSSHLRQLII